MVKGWVNPEESLNLQVREALTAWSMAHQPRHLVYRSGHRDPDHGSRRAHLHHQADQQRLGVHLDGQLQHHHPSRTLNPTGTPRPARWPDDRRPRRPAPPPSKPNEPSPPPSPTEQNPADQRDVQVTVGDVQVKVDVAAAGDDDAQRASNWPTAGHQPGGAAGLTSSSSAWSSHPELHLLGTPRPHLCFIQRRRPAALLPPGLGGQWRVRPGLRGRFLRRGRR
jgi:hypothetical protein